jgi:aryl-alcohol dehydrogenase-like predicted oxidoreductase
MIPRIPFGKTGHDSTRLVFGAAAFWDADQDAANGAIERLLEAGVNHIDAAASYGKAQERLGPALEGRRDSFFLATKTEKRSYSEAMRDLENSLRLLRTDRIDLWQMHCLIDDAEWTEAMGEGGALRAFREAKEQGVVKNLGVTGHGRRAADFHLRSLERFPFDTVLLPWNRSLSLVEDYRASFDRLRKLCEERGAALQLIKVFCRRPWGDRAKTATTWYEPLRESADLKLALGFAFAVPKAFVCSAGDLSLLPGMLEAAASSPPPPSEAEMAALASRTGMSDLFAE